MAQKRHSSPGKESETPKIKTADDYRRATAESQKLETAREGTAAFKRRQALLSAMHQYELHHKHPTYYKGRPESDVAPPMKITDRVSGGTASQRRNGKVE